MAVIFAVFNKDLILASWLIILAAFLDMMDGKVARMTHSSSKFGVEYDSLADLISFGLAPSVLIYAYYFNTWKTVGLFLSFFPLLFGGIRLARFNVRLEGFDKTHFIGLPSPAAANVFSTYIIFMNHYSPDTIHPKVLVIMTFVISVLMVSTIRYDIMPKLNFKGGVARKVVTFFALLALLMLFIYPQTLFFPYILIYVSSGFLRYVWRMGHFGR